MQVKSLHSLRLRLAALAATAPIVVLLGTTAAAAGDCNPSKVAICHAPPGKPDNVQLICVAPPAVPAHLAHGDYPGIVFWVDADGDGFGSGAATTGCAVPAGSVTNDDDCDDTNAAVNPDAAEDCTDSIDNDCDGQIDEQPCIGCVTVHEHCDGQSTVTGTFCGPGPHVLDAFQSSTISFITFVSDVNGVVLHHCDPLHDPPTLTINDSTDFCQLPGGCCGPGRWNDETCVIDLF